MRIAFYGIYRYGLDALQALVAHGAEVSLVITKPDDPDGAPQPVRQLAQVLGIPWIAPESMRDSAVEAALRAARAEAAMVAGFHIRIPEGLLKIPPKGTFNIHGSLLPAFRGPTPWKHAILMGEKELGATVHVMTAEMDRGAILKTVRFPISEEDTGESLFHKTCEAAAQAAVSAFQDIASGKITLREQNELEASSYPNLKDADCEIRWDWPTTQIHNWVRGLYPRPGAWTPLSGERHRLWRVDLARETPQFPPGTIQDHSPEGWLVTARNGCLWIRDLRPEGGGPNQITAVLPAGRTFGV